ncbi:MAG: PQQ-binding-like beta-propeller repeat protein [Sedimentisphaerales bacterium]|nr:PQQ-binding-like beta-propeller repeat protein [Sedimentisphaerales bacterium]
MGIFKSLHYAFLASLCLSAAICSTAEADWPTYRYDNARSGCTAEPLAGQLNLRWVYTCPHGPRPAWSGPAQRPREGFLLRHRVIFDDAYQVAVAGDAVYFGSSADNKVYSLDAATGRRKWDFFTGGPVRLAPTVRNGRVFFGSDDGYAYCLDAKTGQMIWKVHPGPNDERLLGNENMISRWPIRTNLLVDEGVAYFAAGIFPHENVYLCAVRADDGTLIWKNDTISQAEAYRNEFSPQGYILASSKQLFVPSGRGLPVGFDRATGRLVSQSSYGWRGEQAGGLIGGTYALLADDQIYTGTQQHMIALDQRTGKVGFGWFPGRRLAVVANMAYMADGKQIVAIDRKPYAEASRKRNSLEFKIKNLRGSVRTAKGEDLKKLRLQLDTAESDLAKLQRENIAPAVKWSAPSQCDAELVLCENLVIAGGQGQVLAYQRDSGKNLWEKKVDGKARGLAVSECRLYVSTDTGRIYCFDSSQPVELTDAEAEVSRPLVKKPYPEDEMTTVYSSAAEAIIMESGVTKGYCLILGAEQGRLAWELARRTDLNIIAVEPDAEKVAFARRALDSAGLYGHRIVIDQGDLAHLPYSNYFANLIVSDTMLRTGEIPGDQQELVKHLKPCGGVICFGAPANAPGQAGKLSWWHLEQWFKKLQLRKPNVSQTNGLWLTVARGPLPGAGKWTHQYAEPGNTACSDDRIVAGPLGLLWFGEPGPAPMVNRHDAAAAPLAVNGRLLIQGENVVMAYDSYNGAKLWERRIPGAMRARLKGIECGNIAASEDSLFVAVQDKCLKLSAATGETQAVYPLPAAEADGEYPKWGYIAYIDGILYGSATTTTGVSTSIFALDTANAEVLWTYAGGNIGNLTIAIGDGWVFFIDSTITPQQREELLRQDKSRLKNLSPQETEIAQAAQKKIDVRIAVALDARTGGKVWEKPVDVTDCSGIGIGAGRLTTMYRDGVLVLCGANANGHYWKQFLAGQFSQRRLVALSAKTGRLLWAKDANYRHRPVIVGDAVIAEPWAFDLKTGQAKTRSHPLTGEQEVWKVFRPGHHCGAISACAQMLFMRSGFTSYYDLLDDSGIRHFAGHRLGCWVNAIPADGLALMPEASAGCVCLFPIVCSVALEPRPDYERWAIYSTGGENTPVRHLALNLGAAGDRRDSRGTLWLGCPRPKLPGDRAEMGISLPVKTEFLPGGGYYRGSEASPIDGTDQQWIYTSCARAVKRCTVPLLSENDKPAQYTVKLYFADFDNTPPGKNPFDVKLQGEVKLTDFDIAGGTAAAKAVVHEFSGIIVSGDLEIEFVPKGTEPSSVDAAPMLCAIEAVRETDPLM